MAYIIKRSIPCVIFLVLAWFFYGMNYFAVTDVWSIWTDKDINIVSFEARKDVTGFADIALTIPADTSATIAEDTSFGAGDYTAIDGNTIKIGNSYYPTIDFLITKSESDKSTAERLWMIVPISLKASLVAIGDVFTGKMSFARFMEPIAIPSNPFVWLFAIPLVLLVFFYYRGFIAKPWRYLGEEFRFPRRLMVFPVLLVFSLLAAAACFFSKNNFSQGLATGDLQAVLSAGLAFLPPGKVVEGLTAPHWMAVCMYWVCKVFWVAFAVDFVRTYIDTQKLSSTLKFMMITLGFCGLFTAAAIALANALALVLFIIATLLGILFFLGKTGSIVANHKETRYKEYTVTETVDNGFRRMDE